MKVAIVDDHPLFRIGLADVLQRQEDISVVWDAKSAQDAVQRMRQAPVDVLLMDVALQSPSDGLAATVELVAEHPQLKVVVISGSPEQHMATAAIEAGASYFLRKDLSPGVIVACLRHVWAGAAAPELASPNKVGQPSNVARPATFKSKQRLTAREQEVMAHIRMFRTNREIAERLHVSYSTVNKHVHQILSKLGARNRAQAAAMFGMGAGLEPSLDSVPKSERGIKKDG
jgi:DNA-binding NarL/FixJ family response regulator